MRRALVSIAVPWALALALTTGAQALPGLVESLWAVRVYPRVQALLGLAFDRVPVSVSELLLLAGIALAVAGLVRAWRGGSGRLRRLGRLGARAATVVGWGYVVFLLAWGLHYARPDLVDRAGFPDGRVRAEDLRRLADELAAECAALRAEVPVDDAGVATLLDSPRVALRRSDAGFARAEHAFVPTVDGTPKAAWISPLMTRFGVAGIFVPFTGEANVSLDVTDVELPFVACHELAHRAGFASEDEADYVAAVTCRAHPDVDFRYSGAILSLARVLQALHWSDPLGFEARWEALDEGVRRDFDAMAAHWEARSSWLTGVGTGVNDLYLRSQTGVGILSYGQMVELLVAERRAR